MKSKFFIGINIVHAFWGEHFAQDLTGHGNKLMISQGC